MPPSVEDTLIAILSQAQSGASVSPNDVAKAIAGEAWRHELKRVRSVATEMAVAGKLEFIRKGQPVDPRGLKGIYRLRLKA